MFVNVMVRVWEGMVEMEEFMLVSYIVFVVVFIVHVGVRVSEVPDNCAHEDNVIADKDTYTGNFTRILPFDDRPSLIVTFNVYTVTLFTTFVPIATNSPLTVDVTAVKL